MEFLDFCRLHGILIHDTPPMGVWRRYPTEDHPRKRNGAVKYMGDHAFVQNHATETAVSVWRGESGKVATPSFRMIRESQDRMIAKQEEAARKAAWIISKSVPFEHEYLRAKGFKGMKGLVWQTEDAVLLVIPMKVAGRLVGCQLISPDGQKKFLTGQRTSGATFVMDSHGPHILVEGYATGLAVRLICEALKVPYQIHVCFSAGNLARVAQSLPAGLVVADNDASGTGERVAKETGWPYWMSDQLGEDAHDAWVRLGTFRMAQNLRLVFSKLRHVNLRRAYSGHERAPDSV